MKKRRAPLSKVQGDRILLSKEAALFFQLFQRLLQKNRFVRKLTVATLSRAEVHVLVELATMQTRTISDLTALLGFEQSSVSRLIQGLETQGLVVMNTSTADRRIKDISLTKKGVDIVEKIDHVAGALFSEFASRLNVSEQNVLAQFFKEISDSYGQLPGNCRKEESMLRMEQRRITRAFGMLGQEAFGSELSSTQWHVLAEACMRTYPITGKEACYLLGVTPANLTLILNKLSALGYIRRERAKDDSRKVLISATPLGHQAVAKIEEQFVRKLLPLLERHHLAEVVLLRDLLQRYVGAGSAVELVLNSLPGSYHVSRITTDPQLLHAREFLVTRLYQEKLLSYLPELVIAKNSWVYILTHDESPEKILAVLEYRPLKKGIAELALGAAVAMLPKNLLYGFLARCEEMIKLSDGIESTICSFPPYEVLKSA